MATDATFAACAAIPQIDFPTARSQVEPDLAGCTSRKSSILFGRIVGVMFMRVNAQRTHQVRPPLARTRPLGRPFGVAQDRGVSPRAGARSHTPVGAGDGVERKPGTVGDCALA
jgi:hypothetical protein